MTTAPVPRTLPTAWPVVVLLFAATLWGLSWWPLKRFAAAGIEGPLLVLLTYSAAGLVGLPWLLRERPRWQSQSRILVIIALVGGWAMAAFVNALVIGDVVRVMLLFYLSPAWSAIGGRIFLGETISLRRVAAVLMALAGAFLAVGGFGALQSPPTLADGLALSAGLGFAANNVASRAGRDLPMLSKAVAVFAGSGPTALLMLALPGAASIALPAPSAMLGLGLAGYVLVWTVVGTLSWQYGVTHMEAGRAGVILITEPLVAMVSAAWIGGSVITPSEWLGGALIALAAVLEAAHEGQTAMAAHPSPQESA